MAGIRWNVNKAAQEFDIARATLEKRLRAAGEQADGETYSTKQIVRALFGDEDSERLRKVTAEADLLEARRKVIEREYVPTESVLKAWEFLVVTFRQKILNCPELSDRRKSEILEELRSIGKDEYFKQNLAADDSTDAEPA